MAKTWKLIINFSINMNLKINKSIIRAKLNNFTNQQICAVFQIGEEYLQKIFQIFCNNLENIQLFNLPTLV